MKKSIAFASQLLHGDLTDKDNRTYYFCTYFDRHYLARGLALYQSLKQHCPAFRLWVLCLDDETCVALTQLGLPEVRLIALPDFERGDEELLLAKRNRSLAEYYFTCTPSLPLFILNNNPDVDLITYLDADLFFFSSPVPLFDELGTNSIAIIGHRFSPTLKHQEKRGIYNVGWLSFRRDVNGLACLRWWRDRCIEWCYDRVEGDKYADQKYLDKWPTLFQRVAVLQHKGANLAPWNVENHVIRCDGSTIWVDEQPLIFYHFQGVRPITKWCCDAGFRSFRGVKPTKAVLQSIYSPYITILLRLAQLYPFDRGIRGRSGLNLRFCLGKLRALLSIGKVVFRPRSAFYVDGHLVT